MSAPSGPIQVIPPGLLGLLQLKNMGRLPDTLQGNVQPTVDLEAWWLRGERVLLTTGVPSHAFAAGIAATFVGFGTNPIVVPDDEWWYVHSYTVTWGASAGNTVNNPALAALYSTVGTLRYRVLFKEQGLMAAIFVQAASAFWLPPGSQLGMWVDTITGAAVTASAVGLEFTRCST